MRHCPAGIRAIVNNAGIAMLGVFEKLSREGLKVQFEVDVFWIAGVDK